MAGFIGSPQMNLLDVRVEGGALYLGTHRVRLEAVAGAAPAGGITVGVRPEGWELVGADDGIPVRIDLVEELGSDSFAYGSADLGDRRRRVSVRLPHRDPAAAGTHDPRRGAAAGRPPLRRRDRPPPDADPSYLTYRENATRRSGDGLRRAAPLPLDPRPSVRDVTSGSRTLWEQGEEPGHEVAALAVALLLTATTIDLALADRLGLLFDLTFVTVCARAALMVRPADFFTVGVLPPLAMLACVASARGRRAGFRRARAGRRRAGDRVRACPRTRSPS